MGSPAQDAEYYVWEVAGKPLKVHLHLEVVDRLAGEVMRGFGAVPKRGAEVGGVLIGTIESGDPTIVRIEDFEPVDCDYTRGPSYLLGGGDQEAFEDACARWRQDASPQAYAVGYFRSHTRDAMALSSEDVDLMNRWFSAPSQVALLIKPFATKVSPAGFFFREDGVFQPATLLEFPFRRRELSGEEAPPRRSMMERGPRSRDLRSTIPAPVQEFEDEEDYSDAEPIPQSEHAYATTAPAKSRLRSGWVWMPLSFIFLLLGVLLGFQAALTMGSKVNAGGGSDFPLSLSVSRTGDNLSVKWDRQAAAVRAAPRGVIEITDGTQTLTRDLDAAQLQNGNLIYRNSSNAVRFRLSVYPNSRVTVTETMDWKP
jgi:hypothetical protein